MGKTSRKHLAVVLACLGAITALPVVFALGDHPIAELDQRPGLALNNTPPQIAVPRNYRAVIRYHTCDKPIPGQPYEVWSDRTRTHRTPIFLAKSTGTAIPAVRELIGEHCHVAERPTTLLAPNTTYVRALRLRGFPDNVHFGDLDTMDVVDTQAPDWEGILSVAMVKVPGPSPAMSCEGPCTAAPMGTELILDIRVAPALDDVSAAEWIEFAIWASDTQSPIDTSEPPLGYFNAARRDGGYRMLLYPRQLDITLPPSRTLTFAMAPEDQAGNRGPVRQAKLRPRGLCGLLSRCTILQRFCR